MMVPCWDCFYGDNREFDLEEDKVLPFMIKNRLEEEFLTSQSKEEKRKKCREKRRTESKNNRIRDLKGPSS